MARRVRVLTAGLCGAGVVLYLLLVVGLARTRAPYVDEGWIASPGWSLAMRGHMGSAVLDPCFPLIRDKPYPLPRIDQRTYWIMPLHPLMQGLWYRAVGFSLISLRVQSITWSVVFVLAWVLLVRRLAQSGIVSLATGFLIAFDLVVMARAASGRTDMMSAALVSAALASYVLLRHRRHHVALLVANGLVTGAGLTHPLGGILGLLSLSCLTLSLDRRRLDWKSGLMVVIPYVLGALGWGAYILGDPSAFLAQFSANAAGRSQTLAAPLTILGRELRERYLPAYGAGGTSDVAKLRLLVLASYVVACLVCLTRRRVRHRPGVKTLAWLMVVSLIGLAVADSFKLQFYVVYAVPVLAVWPALWLSSLGDRRWLVAGLIALLVSMQVAGAIRLIRRNEIGRDYMPAVEYLLEHNPSRDLTIGSAEMGFGLGFDGMVIDDLTLGECGGRQPAWLVVGHVYREGWEHFLRRRRPLQYERIQRTLREEFCEVFRTPGYSVHKRRAPNDPAMAC